MTKPSDEAMAAWKVIERRMFASDEQYAAQHAIDRTLCLPERVELEKAARHITATWTYDEDVDGVWVSTVAAKDLRVALAALDAAKAKLEQPTT